MQQHVIDQLRHVEVGVPQAHVNLTLVPLLAREAREPGYVTLDEALALGWGQVTEVGEGGHVPELLFRNTGTQPVLLLDGEQLVGAKQNRVVNLTILAPAQSILVIPVSCVEAGRWYDVSAGFQTSPSAHFAEGRAAKMRDVTESLHTAGSRHSDQDQVWSTIDAKAARMGAQSNTSAMEAIFTWHATSVEHFVGALSPVPGQVGAVFLVNGQVRGLELFDASATWTKLSPKLVRSYALDAIDALAYWDGGHANQPPVGPLPLDVRPFLDAVVESETSTFPATGLGTDVRLEGDVVIGSALVVEDRAVHVSAFACVS